MIDEDWLQKLVYKEGGVKRYGDTNRYSFVWYRMLFHALKPYQVTHKFRVTSRKMLAAEE